MHPNRLVAEALAADAIPELTGYDVHPPRGEVSARPAGSTSCSTRRTGRPASVEVKNVPPAPRRRAGRVPRLRRRPLGRSTCASWPREVARGNRAVQLFVVQRTDCERFAPAPTSIPPTRPASRPPPTPASRSGYACDITPEAVTIARRIGGIVAELKRRVCALAVIPGRRRRTRPDRLTAALSSPDLRRCAAVRDDIDGWRTFRVSRVSVAHFARLNSRARLAT